MREPASLTDFQKVLYGLKILNDYLSRDNPGEIIAEHDEIFVVGVHHDALGGDDRAMLEAMGWFWTDRLSAWKHFV